MHLSNIQIVLWFTTLASELLLVFSLRRSHAAKRFPRFCLFATFIPCKTIILMAIFFSGAEHGRLSSLWPSYYAYFWTAWSGTAVNLFLQVAVLSELWREIDLDKVTHARAFTVLLVLFSVIIAIWSSYSPSTFGRSGPMTAVYTCELAVQFVECAAFLVLIVCSNVMGVEFRGHTAAIFIGLAMIASSEIVVSSLHSINGSVGYETLKNIRSLVFLTSIGIWITGLLKAEPPPVPLSLEESLELHAIAQELITLRKETSSW